MIYIIADDLTGATDTGVQFSKQGYRTQVVIVTGADFQPIPDTRNVFSETDVLVIDTETREASPSTARHRIRHILEHLPANEDDIVYKKVDSTLRGNIGVELDECLNVLHKDVCVFTPSLPANKRITVEGYLIVQDQPLGLSEYYSGHLAPEDASYIPNVLESATDFPIARIDLKHVMRGEETILQKLRKLVKAGRKILVVDAINDTQLQHILQSCSRFEGSVLYSGSAGLANAISTGQHNTRQVTIQKPSPEKSVLIVSGSMNMTTLRQLEYLSASPLLCKISIDVKQLLNQTEACLQQARMTTVQALHDGHYALICPDPACLEEWQSQELLSEFHLTFRELGITIRDFLGRLTSAILEETQTNKLIVTGGDTAIGVCSALGLYNLTILDEFLPGIPLSSGVLKDRRRLNIATKAGGFGEEDALYIVLEKLIRLGK